MKYIVFWEFCPEDIDKAVEKHQAFGKEVEKHPDKYPEILFPSHWMAGETKGFEVVEATSEQMTEDINAWMGILKQKYVPILEPAKVIESYLKLK